MRANNQSRVPKRTLFVCRHGERMDVVFGKHWITQCFDAKGQSSGVRGCLHVFILCMSLSSVEHFPCFVSYLCVPVIISYASPALIAVLLFSGFKFLNLFACLYIQYMSLS